MSSDNNLQEMEAGTTQSKTAVNAKAAAADPMPKLSNPGPSASVEDLGGPTPENYKPDDDSAKLKTPTLAQVKNIVNKGAGKADPMPAGVKEEEDLSDEEVVAEEETTEEEVVAEEETTEEEVVAEEEEVVAEYDIEEDVNALLAGEELSEEFQEKARTIFEAAINSKVASIKEGLEKEYEEKFVSELAEAIVETKEELTTRVDSYLEYVADEWFNENQLAVEAALKTEMTESFISGMKELFEAHYVNIPDEKYDVLESMVDKLDDMETKLNEQIEKNVSLNARLSESVADGILTQVSEGLAQTQKEKLASLSESVEFESEEQYREKLETLKESYFKAEKKTPTTAKTESLSEGVEDGQESYSNSMAAYLKTLSVIAKS
nr:scaffold prohead core protein [uncultured Mediterranean phage uvMED]